MRPSAHHGVFGQLTNDTLSGDASLLVAAVGRARFIRDQESLFFSNLPTEVTDSSKKLCSMFSKSSPRSWPCFPPRPCYSEIEKRLAPTAQATTAFSCWPASVVVLNFL
jgi:hypothetical protein